MYTTTTYFLTGLVALLVGVARPGLSQEKVEKRVQERVAELLAVIARPDATSENLPHTAKALRELEKIGAPAVPQLIDAVLGKDMQVATYVQKLLNRIGKPALPAIHARWGDLSDAQRWKLMPLREKYELDSVREYAWNCVESDQWVEKAWWVVLRTKDPRAKERYFRILRGEETNGLEWGFLQTEPVYDATEENKILIELLKPGSWTAKKFHYIAEGRRPSWWPDGRERVVEIVRSRKLSAAAPALLALLQEKGRGVGYFAEQIVPALAEFGYKEAIPELERLARMPGKPDDSHRYSNLDIRELRRLAEDALANLRQAKP